MSARTGLPHTATSHERSQTAARLVLPFVVYAFVSSDVLQAMVEGVTSADPVLKTWAVLCAPVMAGSVMNARCTVQPVEPTHPPPSGTTRHQRGHAKEYAGDGTRVRWTSLSSSRRRPQNRYATATGRASFFARGARVPLHGMRANVRRTTETRTGKRTGNHIGSFHGLRTRQRSPHAANVCARRVQHCACSS